MPAAKVFPSAASGVLGALPVPRAARLRLRFKATGAVHLPAPIADAWRGQLGNFLKRVDAEKRHAEGLSDYQRLFRTPRKAVDLPDDLDDRALARLGLMGEHVPHPFVLRFAEPPGTDLHLIPGDTLTLRLTLVEDAVRHVPVAGAALESVALQGIGRRTRQPNGRKRRGAMRLQRATLRADGSDEQVVFEGSAWNFPASCDAGLYDNNDARGASSPTCDDEEEALQVEARTPLRLKHHGEVIAQPDDLTAEALAVTLVRRLGGLAVCYGAASPASDDVARWQDAAYELGRATTLAPRALRRESVTRRRKGNHHPLGGIVGTFRLMAPAPVRNDWRRLLRKAEPVHVGNKTSWGRGWLVLQESPVSQNT